MRLRHGAIYLIALLLTAAPLVTAVANWNDLPDLIATRFSTDGTPVESMDKPLAVASIFFAMLAFVAVAALFLKNKSTSPLVTAAIVGLEYFVLAFVSVVATGVFIGQATSEVAAPSLQSVIVGCVVGVIVALVVVPLAWPGRRSDEHAAGEVSIPSSFIPGSPVAHSEDDL